MIVVMRPSGLASLANALLRKRNVQKTTSAKTPPSPFAKMVYALLPNLAAATAIALIQRSLVVSRRNVLLMTARMKAKSASKVKPIAKLIFPAIAPMQNPKKVSVDTIVTPSTPSAPLPMFAIRAAALKAFAFLPTKGKVEAKNATKILVS